MVFGVASIMFCVDIVLGNVGHTQLIFHRNVCMYVCMYV